MGFVTDRREIMNDKTESAPLTPITPQGKASFIKTSRGLFPISDLQKAEVVDSKQLSEIQAWMTQNDFVDPPYPPESFLLLHESSPIFWAITNQIGNDVAGLGWNLQLIEGQTEDNTERNKALEFLNTCALDSSLHALLKELIVDWGSIGYFGVEVIRNAGGDVCGIARVPAHTLRVHKSKEKFAQVRGEKKVWFKRFGTESNITAADGRETTEADLKLIANELIYYRNTYQKSDYYGCPNILAATGDIVGLISSRDYNISFFKNFGVPESIIILKGTWAEGTVEGVKKFLSTEIKGAENAHRTLVMEQPEGVEIEYKALTTEVKEGSFKLYQQQSKENILTAYSMPPERIGIQRVGALGGDTTREANKIYNQAVVEPLQSVIEGIVNKLLVQGLQITNYTFVLNNLDLEDKDALVNRLAKEIEYGLATPNECRNVLGRKPYDEGNKFYISPALVEVGTEVDEHIQEYEKNGKNKHK